VPLVCEVLAKSGSVNMTDDFVEFAKNAVRDHAEIILHWKIGFNPFDKALAELIEEAASCD
jgi:hypothetical protein